MQPIEKVQPMTDNTNILVPYPWHRSVWQQLLQQIENAQLPHALLFSGLEGVGKVQLAKSLAQILLCQEPIHGLACGNCKGCHLFRADTHPDFYPIQPEAGKQIKIEEIRALQDSIASSAQQGGRKVVVMGPAEALNLNAANAILKTLEEPPGATHLLLFTHQLSSVLPTIKSRCQALQLPVPKSEQSLPWLTGIAGEKAGQLLADSRGLPLKALSWLETDQLALRDEVFATLLAVTEQRSGPVSAASKLTQYPLDQVCLLVIEEVETRVERSITGSSYSAGATSWQLKTTKLMLFRDKVLQLLTKVRKGNNPNQQLAIEELLLEYARL